MKIFLFWREVAKNVRINNHNAKKNSGTKKKPCNWEKKKIGKWEKWDWLEQKRMDVTNLSLKGEKKGKERFENRYRHRKVEMEKKLRV